MNPEDVKIVQVFLWKKGFISEEPSENWSPHKLYGYKNFVMTFYHGYDTNIPNQVENLPDEVQKFLRMYKSINIEDSDSTEVALISQPKSGESDSQNSVEGNSNTETEDSTSDIENTINKNNSGTNSKPPEENRNENLDDDQSTAIRLN